jgi:hypothetical protein
MLGGAVCVCWPADGLGDHLGLLPTLFAANFGAYSQKNGDKSQNNPNSGSPHPVGWLKDFEVMRKPFGYDPELMEKARWIVERGPPEHEIEKQLELRLPKPTREPERSNVHN